MKQKGKLYLLIDNTGSPFHSDEADIHCFTSYLQARNMCDQYACEYKLTLSVHPISYLMEDSAHTSYDTSRAIEL